MLRPTEKEEEEEEIIRGIRSLFWGVSHDGIVVLGERKRVKEMHLHVATVTACWIHHRFHESINQHDFKWKLRSWHYLLVRKKGWIPRKRREINGC